MRQITQALAAGRDERGDWERALRHFNPLTFDECGSVRADSPGATYVPTEQEVRDLRFYGPPEDDCSGPGDEADDPADVETGAQPGARAPATTLAFDEHGGIRVTDRSERPPEWADAAGDEAGDPRDVDWGSMPADERADALRGLAMERGLNPEALRWSPVLGIHIEIPGARTGSDPYHVDEITDRVSNDALFQTIRAQGGLGGIEITDEVRESPRYQQLMLEAHAQLMVELVLPLVPSRGVARTPLGRLEQSQESLITNVLTGRPEAEQILAITRQRADERMTYELALERLGRGPAAARE
jgi:hypothetical protein